MAEGIYEKVFDLAKRRGFLYPAFDLYGGAAGFYDYGPLGAQMKAQLEDLFRRIFVVEDGCAEINTPALTVEPVLKASGHVDHFSDVVITCRKCGAGFRADHFLVEELVRIREKLQKSNAPAGFRQGATEQIDGLIARIKEKPSVESAEQIRKTQVTLEGDSVVSRAAFDTARFWAGGFDESIRCLQCKANEFLPASAFNLMFKTFLGPGSSKPAYLRPETAQAMFVNFPFLYRYFREKLPFGICQIGRAYRNEISPRQGLIRLREFNQMEVELFFDPGQDAKTMTHPRWAKVKKTPLHLVPNSDQKPVTQTAAEAVKQGSIYSPALAYYLVQTQRLLVDAGLHPDRLRFRQHLKDEMAHYAADCWDAEFYSDRFGWVECVGIADRGSYDLSQHAKLSGQPLAAVRKFDAPDRREVTRVVPNLAKLGPLFRQDAPRVAEALSGLSEVQAEAAKGGPALAVQFDGRAVSVPREAFDVRRETVTRAGEEFVPRVIEPSFGEDRILYAILEHNFKETTKEGEHYAVLTLPARMAPITVGVFPLMPKDGLDALARRAEEKLKQAGLRTYYDDAGTIGRRYARMDEVGTPFAVTIDYDSLKDRTVTVRDRDTMQQERVRLGALASFLRRRLSQPARRAVATPRTTSA